MTTPQSEYSLEENLINQLQELGYNKVVIKDESYLTANLKAQLEKHNKTTLSDKEFKQVLKDWIYLNVLDYKYFAGSV